MATNKHSGTSTATNPQAKRNVARAEEKMAQLQSLLWSMYGVGKEWLDEIGSENRDNILWLASDLAEDIARLRGEA